VQRREAVVAQIADVGAQLAQTIDQIADRPFMHARNALQHVIAASQRQRCSQRAEGGTSVAQEKLSLLDRESTAAANDLPVFTAQMRDTNTQRLQGFEHALGIVRGEQIADLGLTIGQRRQQQHAVGDTL
jgi:hypothetical protein